MAQVLKRGAASLERRQGEAKSQKERAVAELQRARDADDRVYREKVEFGNLSKSARTLAYLTLGITYLIYKAVAYRRTHKGHPDLWREVYAAQSTVFLNEQGLRGENFISSLLEQRLPGGWIILDDLRIRSAQSPSGYAQIDHVVISPRAVYCIETKNWRGRYLRTEQGWITKYKLEHGIHEFKKDPVPQARNHATALEDALKSLQLNVPVYPVIVFTNNEFEYLSQQGDVPVTIPNFLVRKMLNHSLPSIVPDTMVLAKKMLALHKEARPHNNREEEHRCQ